MKRSLTYALAAPPLIFLGVFYFYPLVSIFSMSLAPDGIWNTAQLYQLVRSSYYARVLWFTTWQAGVSTFLTLVSALPAAYVFARFNFKHPLEDIFVQV